MYSVKFPEEACNETYNGETGRLVERNDKHRRKDQNSYLHQLSSNLNHTIVTLDNFTILNSWYKQNKWKSNRTNKIRWFPWDFLIETFPAGIYLLKVNNRNSRTRCEICSKLAITTPERRHWRVFIVNFKHIPHLYPVILLLTLKM